MSDLPIYGAAIERRAKPPRRPVPRRQLVAVVAAFAAIAAIGAALAASTPSPQSFAPYYLPKDLPDGWTLAAVSSRNDASDDAVPVSRQTFAEVDSNGFFDRVVRVETHEGFAAIGGTVAENEFTAVNIGPCGAYIRMRAVSQADADRIVDSATCTRSAEGPRMVVDIPFETREVDVHISARSPGYVAHYRRTDGAVLSVVAGPRAEDIDLRYSAAFADERVLQRFKYGYLRSAQWFSDCGVASSAFAWRVDRNRVVSVWGTVDRASAVAVLRSVERVTSKRWHEVTDPVADQPVPDQTDPCRFIDN